MEVQRFTMVDGHPTLGGGAGWVYAWICDGVVLHVGATWLHPAARAEAHVHADQPEARTPHLARSCDHGTPVVLAFPVPDGCHRAVHRDALTRCCIAEALVGAGFTPRGAAASGDTDPGGIAEVDPGWLAEATAAVRAECRRD